MKERYQDFQVKMGIIKPEDSELNHSPDATKSNFNFKCLNDCIGRKEIENYIQMGSSKNANFDMSDEVQNFAMASIKR